MEECIHLLAPGTCSTCNSPRTPVRRLIPTPPTGTMEARFDSRCPRCDETIHEGDEIGAYLDDWIHIEHFEESL